MSARYHLPTTSPYSPASNPSLSQPPPPPPPPPSLSAIHTARLSAVPGTSSAGGPSSSSSNPSFVAGSPLYAQHLQQDRRWSPTSPPTVASPGPSPGSFLRGAGAINSPPSPHGSAWSAVAESASRSSSPMATRGPSGLVAEYNPQQWGARGPAGGAYIPHSALPPSTRRNVDDGDPNPPPPYSPAVGPNESAHPLPLPSSRPRPSHGALPLLQTALLNPSSSLGEFASPQSAITVISPLSMLDRRQNIRAISSPLNPASNTPISFPPPPGRDRSASRSRFGLSALTRGRSSDRSLAQVPDLPQTVIDPSQRPTVSRHDTPPLYLPLPQSRIINTIPDRSSVYTSTTPILEPPSSRRSASAGAISHHHPGSQIHQQPNLDGGLALPPPPPGPPPSSSRSASVNPPSSNRSIEVGNITVPILSIPTGRPNRRGTMTVMDPIPPTPADWVEDSRGPKALAPTRQVESSQSEASYDPSETSSSDRLRESELAGAAADYRDMGRRDTTVKGIRERRSESRAARDRVLRDQAAFKSANESKPANLVLASPSTISRQRAVKKSRSSVSPQEAGFPQKQAVFGKKPIADPTVTPPFSPGTEGPNAPQRNPSIPPKALPTPPPGSSGKGKMRSLELSGSSRPESEYDLFAQSSQERHQAFTEKELAANSDRERLELFAAYIVAESRLRRDRYSGAFSAMASDIFDLTRDLWRSYQPSPTFGTTPPKVQASPKVRPKAPTPNRKQSFDSHGTNSPQSARTDYTPRTESESPSSNAPHSAGRQNPAWTYQPVLSPIPSMAMSTVPDEEGRSRGRSASRWWESDDGSLGAGQRIERSKRESKYMGLHREGRLNLQWEDEPSPSATPGTAGRAGPSNEYPLEKVGWHDENSADLPTPHYSVPNTPSATSGLDVSRLVTLPPSYPRHYPAMNNSHPDLDPVRAILRIVTDMSEVTESKSKFEAKISRQRELASQEAASRSTQVRENIAEQVRLGHMSYSEAAAAEETFRKSEAKKDLATFRREFDAYKPEVMTPLHALLSERITKASASISQLQAGLSTSVSESSPEAPMEEGDERPELLEKLKLLKWLVEAREALHRGLFELESDRDERYRHLVTSDLKGRGEPESKLKEADRFFGKDRMDRRAKFEREARSRMEDLAAAIDTHVSRGVEDQLSAFWDIAPGLLELVKKIPESEARLEELPVAIQRKEIEENPSYVEYPLQYLHGLLRHAEKATYQFIENQVGLLCLLHEVGLCVMRAGLRVVEVDRCAAEGVSEDDPEVQREMSELGRFEEERLTGELKDRVGVVEGQWRDALGGSLSSCLDRVERVLRETGGWDESLAE